LPLSVNLWFHSTSICAGAAQNDGSEMTFIDDLSFSPSILV
jgi:hypothetical protein